MEKALISGFKRNTLALSVAAASAAFTLGPGVSYGQDEVQDIEEITVTGSRIRTTSGFEASTPVTSMEIPDLFDFEPGGTIAEQLDALPQFFNTQTTQRGGGALFGSAGQSGLNLRSLGSNRTLVLLDGSRVAPTDKRGLVNVDLLPTNLMRSVDVVTGGASAAYGADAVAGVVNFVLDREFEGLKANIGGGQLEGGEGKRWETEIAFGQGFFNDRLHVIGSISAREIDEIGDGDIDSHDNFRRIGWVTNPEWVANPALRGTKGTPQRLTLPNVVSSLSSPTGLIRAPGTPLDMKQFTVDGTDIEDFVLGDVVSLPGFRGSTSSMSGGPEAKRAFKTFRNNSTGAEAITRAYFLGFKFDATDRLSFTLEGRGGRTESNSTNRRGAFEHESPWFLSIPVDNAFLPENVRQMMIDNGLETIRVDKLGSFLNGTVGNGLDVESGQMNFNVFTQWQWGWGFEYRIPGVEWTLEGRWQRGESKRNSQARNEQRVDRNFLALDAVRDPETGAIVCRVQLFNPTLEELRASVEGRISSLPVSPFINPADVDPSQQTSAGVFGNTQPLEAPIGLDNSIRDCVPYNVLGAGNINPAAWEFVHSDKTGEGFVDQDFAEVLVSGDLFNLPAGPVSAAVGLTWRDQQFIDGAKSGFGGPGADGNIVPIEALGPPLNAPELGIRGISPGFIGGSPNLHKFSTVPNVGGQTDVWEWFWELQVPVWESTWGQDFLGFEQRVDLNGAFRQSDYDRSGDSSSWKVGIDFRFHQDWRLRWTRSRDVREPTFSEMFDAQGGGGSVDDPRFGNAAQQITSVSGGNPFLNPEESNTKTAGVVWQPSFAPWIDGLQISVDWWQIEIEGRVDRLGLQRIVNECFINGILCDQIQLQPDGGIGRVFNTFLNLAESSERGTDLEVQWQAEPNLFPNQLENFNVRWLASYLEELSETPLGGSARSSAGGQRTPRYTHTLTTNYGIGPWSIQLQNRFLSGTLVNTNWREGIDVDDNTISSMSWWNARVGYRDELANGATWAVNFNIQNIFDREPPVVPGFRTRGGTQSVTPNRFDIFGRRYNLSVNYNF